MKILITLTYYSPHISGLTLYIENLANKLREKGYKITILTTQHNKNLPRKEVEKNLSIYRVPFEFKINKGFFMLRYVSDAIRHITNTDYVITVLPQAESIFIAILSKFFQKRLIVIYQCDILLPQSLTNKLIEKILKFIHFFVLLFSEKIITLSEDFAKNSKLLRLFPSKTIEIFPPIITPIISRKMRENLIRELVIERKYYIGYLGRIAEDKGIDYLLNAIPYLSKELKDDFLILIAGPTSVVGEEKYAKEINTLMIKYKKFIHFYGQIDQKEKGAFYSLLDVFVLPSINSTEAFGMVQVEAMLCGIPVVASELPGVRIPIIKTGMGELAKSANSKNIAVKIISVIKNRGKYIRRKAVIENIFSLNNTIFQYEKIFRMFR